MRHSQNNPSHHTAGRRADAAHGACQVEIDIGI